MDKRRLSGAIERPAATMGKPIGWCSAARSKEVIRSGITFL
jgi:hypothetical protein